MDILNTQENLESQRDKERFDEDPTAQLLAEHGLLINGVPFDRWFEINIVVEKLVHAYKVFLRGEWPSIKTVNIGGVDVLLKDHGLDETFVDTEYDRARNLELINFCIHKGIKKSNIIKELENSK